MSRPIRQGRSWRPPTESGLAAVNRSQDPNPRATDRRDFLPAERMAVMGILNVTPDSFSDGGEHPTVESAVEHGRRLVAEGADWIDVGGESTRPGADEVSIAEECRRILPVIEALAGEIPAGISVDTSKAEVAAEAIRAGGTVVNDVSAGGDSGMLPLVARTGAGIVLMHRRGFPKTMQRAPRYYDVVTDVLDWLSERADRAVREGVPEDRVLIDPGIGFGKVMKHNLALLNQLDRFTATGWPVVVGASRKSFLGQILDLPLGERLEGSLAVAVLAAAAGVRMIRVHDVASTVRAVRVAEAIGRAT